MKGYATKQKVKHPSDRKVNFYWFLGHKFLNYNIFLLFVKPSM